MEEVNIEKGIQIFEDSPIRTVWGEQEEEWYFSVVDFGIGFDDARRDVCNRYFQNGTAERFF